MAYYSSLFNHIKEYSLKSCVILISFYIILSFGCIYQLYNIFELYLSYPIIVSTETEFTSDINELPAFTFCGKIGNVNQLLTINETFHKFNKTHFFKQTSIVFDEQIEQNISEHITDSVIFSLNSRYFCYTINSLLRSMYFILFNRYNSK
jgi:hypothetical protein